MYDHVMQCNVMPKAQDIESKSRHTRSVAKSWISIQTLFPMKHHWQLWGWATAGVSSNWFTGSLRATCPFFRHYQWFCWQRKCFSLVNHPKCKHPNWHPNHPNWILCHPNWYPMTTVSAVPGIARRNPCQVSRSSSAALSQHGGP